MTDPFESPNLLMEGAEESAREFDEIARPFLDQSNWTDSSFDDPETGERVGRITFKTAVPKKLAVRTKRGFGELIDALDHALFASAVLIKGKGGKRCTFPFGETPAKLEQEFAKGRCDDLHGEIQKIIIASKPYKGGNSFLWAANRIRNASVHEVVTPMGAGGGFGVSNSFGGGQVRSVHEWNETRRELTLWRASSPKGAFMAITALPAITLNPHQGMGPLPVPAALMFCRQTVASLIDEIKVTAHRIASETA